jgi:acetoin:2,6-dichlorophenolindophenol oxidoreductase subunit beta
MRSNSTGATIMREITYLQAVQEAFREEMRRDPRVFMMGEDLRANLFGAAGGFVEEFGLDRVLSTPLSEAGFTGAAAGAAMVGMRPIVDYGIAPFLYCAMDQLVSIVAKSTYLYGGQAKLPMVMRAPMFYGKNTAAQHSDRPHPLFMSIPGFKVILPSNAYDMKGLLKSAIRDDDPVLCFEDSTLWGARSEVPEEEYLVPLGRADVKREGNDATVVALGGTVAQALAAAEELANENISVEVVDPRTLVPLDKETILSSVKKTGRLVTVDMAHKTCSAASEIAAMVAEEGFWDLKGPLIRVTTPDTHIPFSPVMERPLYPNKEKIVAAIHQTLA